MTCLLLRLNDRVREHRETIHCVTIKVVLNELLKKDVGVKFVSIVDYKIIRRI